ncbi:C4-dicarboxylate ABC transporter [Litchfieldella anticariensis FP35 = DSM 16096]|uniref:TRAP transporter large permease protein n=1 Tax=Litchfieldella anticariensis (strain DSM 16096 / CECT 5854 / CIP 108499 / LMG 22089 / FP35) TaxID=1121939 RepID=S2KRD9_LITA3|nr:TRAP transporter large permease subunit [Halomonas anticariensis]EPC04440.1 C4-dicarboxylate ABC transporter [Halomonas anticariensis FP35 = DSM 16096]
MVELIPLFMFGAVCLVLLFGYPVAYSLAGTALLFAGIGIVTDTFASAFLHALPSRIYGILTNQTLMAVPLFVLMGTLLEKSKVAENLLNSMALLFGRLRGGLGISVTLVGMLLAASTGIVGATVVTMGLLSLPTMLKRGYSPSLATGSICATGTLGQIIPPSIALVLLGDVLSSAYQQAQINMGLFSPETVSVGDLFVGALIPGLLLVLCYVVYICLVAWLKPTSAPALTANDLEVESERRVSFIGSLVPPLLLILAVLGSILAGIATPTEAAGVGAMGALLLALSQKQLSKEKLREVVISTTQITCMVFLILIGAALFSLVFRGFGGDDLVHGVFEDMPGGVWGATLIVMLVIFFLGFILDFIEITFVVVPIVAPVLLTLGLDPVWLGIMIAINLQTSFLTPPFGFSLFYLRGVAPESVKTVEIYKGVTPFILIQLCMLFVLALWPGLITWLPGLLSR